MSARSGLVGKNPPGPIWGHLGQFFAWTGKMKKSKILRIFLGGPMGPIHPVWANGPGWGAAAVTIVSTVQVDEGEVKTITKTGTVAVVVNAAERGVGTEISVTCRTLPREAVLLHAVQPLGGVRAARVAFGQPGFAPGAVASIQLVSCG